MDPSFHDDAFSFVTKVIHNMDIGHFQISCILHKCFVLQIGQTFLEFTAQKANFEILMPLVDNRHTTMCSVDGWGDRNTKYTSAPVYNKFTSIFVLLFSSISIRRF